MPCNRDSYLYRCWHGCFRLLQAASALYFQWKTKSVFKVCLWSLLLLFNWNFMQPLASWWKQLFMSRMPGSVSLSCRRFGGPEAGLAATLLPVMRVRLAACCSSRLGNKAAWTWAARHRGQWGPLMRQERLRWAKQLHISHCFFATIRTSTGSALSSKTVASNANAQRGQSEKN